MCVSHITILKTLFVDKMHLCHLQRMQEITPDHYLPRFNLVHWHSQQTVESQTFPADVLFTVEVTFSLSAMLKFHNSNFWGNDDPHITTMLSLYRKIKNSYLSNFMRRIHQSSLPVQSGIITHTSL